MPIASLPTSLMRSVMKARIAVSRRVSSTGAAPITTRRPAARGASIDTCPASHAVPAWLASSAAARSPNSASAWRTWACTWERLHWAASLGWSASSATRRASAVLSSLAMVSPLVAR